MLVSFTAWAGNEKTSNYLNGTNITTNATLNVADNYYPYYTKWDNVFYNRSSSVNVKLEFLQSEFAYYSGDWTITIEYDIELEDDNGNNPTITGETLTIDYDKATSTPKYVDLDMRRYNGYAYGKITVKTITKTGITTIPDDVELTLEYVADKCYKLDENATITVVQPTVAAGDNEMLLEWNHLLGAESYDVEWVFVETGDESTSPVIPLIEYDWTNATRVNVPTNKYTVSLAYPKGMIVYRVRATGYFCEDYYFNKVKTGKWSYDPTPAQMNINTAWGSGNAILFNGLNTDMNWTYNGAYAEDGKKKEIISYFDGSQRNRQTVTVLNTDDNAIVGETVYDFEGRPGVNFLPTPVSSNGLDYYINSNGTKAFNGGYSRDDFATDAHLNKTNGTGADAAATTDSEASEYYSSSNGSSNAYKDYIPKAENYPFSHTVYAADGTDRPIAQTGVGPDFQYDNDPNHETRYYYGKPTQVELDRLFGNEVGDKSKYSKNMVRDANGQMTVSYLDQSGRTIATALAGADASSMLPIDNKPTFSTYTEDLLAGVNTPDENDIAEVSTVICPSTTTNYSFVYKLTSDSWDEPCWEDKTCKYDLRIAIIDNFDNSVIKEIDWTVDPDAASFNPSGGSTTYEFTKSLDPGCYTVSKQLRLNQATKASYVDLFETYLRDNYDTWTAPDNCFDLPTIPQEGCDNCATNCEKAFQSSGLDANGDPTTLYYDANGNYIKPGTSTYYTALSQEYIDAVDDCKENCDNIEIPDDACQIKYDMMLAHMSPGGQYFDNTPSYGDVNYDINDWLETNIHQYPCSTSYTGISSYCSWDDVRANWDPDWAEELVGDHPEYCAWEYFCHVESVCMDDVANPDDWEISINTNFDANEYVYLMNKSDDDCYALGGGTGCAHSAHNYNFFDPIDFVSDANATSTSNGHTANNTNFINLNSATSYDDLAVYSSCSTHGANFNNQLNADILDALRNFYEVDDNGTTYTYSIWYVLDNPDNITAASGGTGPADAQDFFDDLHGQFSSNTITKYQFFKGVYQFYRSYFLYEYLQDDHYQCGTESPVNYTY